MVYYIKMKCMDTRTGVLIQFTHTNKSTNATNLKYHITSGMQFIRKVWEPYHSTTGGGPNLNQSCFLTSFCSTFPLIFFFYLCFYLLFTLYIYIYHSHTLYTRSRKQKAPQIKNDIVRLRTCIIKICIINWC